MGWIRRCGQHHRPIEIVGHTQSVETIVGLLPSQVKESEGSSTLHPTATKEIGQVQFQGQAKLRIDRVDVEVRPVIDGQHDVRDAEDLHPDLSKGDLLFPAEQWSDEDVDHFEEMGTSTDHVDRKNADDHQRDAKVRVLLAVVGEGGVH